MTTTPDSRREAAAQLEALIPDLDAAAMPTKCEVFTACGHYAARIRDALMVVLDSLPQPGGGAGKGLVPEPSSCVPEAAALKPCPFCGCDDAETYRFMKSGRHWTSCVACGADGPLGVSDTDAIAAWNRRAPSEGLRDGAAPPRPGDIRYFDGKPARFIEADDKGDVWEVIATPTPTEAEELAGLWDEIAHHFESSGYAHGQHIAKARAAKSTATHLRSQAAQIANLTARLETAREDERRTIREQWKSRDHISRLDEVRRNIAGLRPGDAEAIAAAQQQMAVAAADLQTAERQLSEVREKLEDVAGGLERRASDCRQIAGEGSHRARLDGKAAAYAHGAEFIRGVLASLSDKPASAQPDEGGAGGSAPTVVDEIAAERRRQIDAEGWTPEHDDEHADGSLALAATVYASGLPVADDQGELTVIGQLWPWEWSFKPKGRRRDLIRAAALIVAEIERLDRASPTPDAGKEGA